MRKIYGIGETVFDIIFKNEQPQAAKAGGAMLNSTVSLGRIGLPVSLISEYAGDNVGKLIDSFLTANGVGTDHVTHFHLPDSGQHHCFHFTFLILTNIMFSSSFK